MSLLNPKPLRKKKAFYGASLLGTAILLGLKPITTTHTKRTLHHFTMASLVIFTLEVYYRLNGKR